MGIDGPIDSFAPFHNVNCPRGFLYFNRQVGRLRSRYCPPTVQPDALPHSPRLPRAGGVGAPEMRPSTSEAPPGGPGGVQRVLGLKAGR